MRRFLVVIAAAAVLTACGGDDGDDTTSTTSSTTSSTGSSSTTAPPALQLTEQGLGALEIGMSTSAATATNLIGALGPGCELSGPGQQAAPLRGGLQGSATFADGNLASISIRSGAGTAADITVGSSLADVQAAYGSDGYAVAVDDGTVAAFGVELVTVTKGGDPAFGMTVDPDTDEVTELGTPGIQFCD